LLASTAMADRLLPLGYARDSAGFRQRIQKEIHTRQHFVTTRPLLHGQPNPFSVPASPRTYGLLPVVVAQSWQNTPFMPCSARATPSYRVLVEQDTFIPTMTPRYAYPLTRRPFGATPAPILGASSPRPIHTSPASQPYWRAPGNPRIDRGDLIIAPPSDVPLPYMSVGFA